MCAFLFQAEAPDLEAPKSTSERDIQNPNVVDAYAVARLASGVASGVERSWDHIAIYRRFAHLLRVVYAS